jgi:hypothetical protein
MKLTKTAALAVIAIWRRAAASPTGMEEERLMAQRPSRLREPTHSVEN